MYAREIRDIDISTEHRSAWTSRVINNRMEGKTLSKGHKDLGNGELNIEALCKEGNGAAEDE